MLHHAALEVKRLRVNVKLRQSGGKRDGLPRVSLHDVPASEQSNIRRFDGRLKAARVINDKDKRWGTDGWRAAATDGWINWCCADEE